VIEVSAGSRAASWRRTPVSFRWLL